jgi:putative transposase
MLRALLILLASVLRNAIALFRSRKNQAIVELALRQQLAVYVHQHPRPRLSPLDRAFWVTLSRAWPPWRGALILVQPETVICWHRRAFRGYWRWASKPGPGRPATSEETKALIVRMATENRWRARKIQAELSKLGIRLGLTTISRYYPSAAGEGTHSSAGSRSSGITET